MRDLKVLGTAAFSQLSVIDNFLYMVYVIPK